MHGVHLTRTAENVAEIDALATRLAPGGGGRVPVGDFLADLRATGRRGRRAPLGRLLGRRVRRSFTWDAADRRDPLWWPQGITSSADAADGTGLVDGRRVLVVSWYAKPAPTRLVEEGAPAQPRLVEEGAPAQPRPVEEAAPAQPRPVEEAAPAQPRPVEEAAPAQPRLVEEGALAPVSKPAGRPVAHDGGQGSRLTFVDLDTLRYRHVLLVVPTLRDGEVHLEPLRVHAGGIVWRGPYVHVAATARGFVTVRLDDLMWAPVEGDSLFGYRWVLPVRFTHRAANDEGVERLRYSFLSLDRSVDPPGLLAGEYGRRKQTRRLAHYPLDEAGLPAVGEDGFARPAALDDAGLAGMQGAVRAGGPYFVTASHGPWTPGSLYAGRPGAFHRHRWALPMGPEDITWSPADDLLWTVTEHPRRRWVVAVPRPV